MSKLLVIEDDANTREAVAECLRRSGFVVDAVADGKEGLFLAQNYAYDLLVIDWNLPGMDGTQIIQELRQKGKQFRILMLTAHTDLTDKVSAFNLGADDYLCKPFAMEELVVRAQALLRRPEPKTSSVLKAEKIELDTTTRKVVCNSREVQLNPTEYTLLEFFMSQPMHVFTADQLLNSCWKSMSETTEGAVRYHITGLRKKIDHEGIEGSYIETVHGAGYRFVPSGAGKKPGKQGASAAGT
jgi:DNA-binding response OmpR family regulator